MTTKAIEAGARAIAASYGEDQDDYASLLDICGPNNEPLLIWQKYAEQAKACIEAALASGELVPASAVAAERELWRQRIRALRELVLIGGTSEEIQGHCFDLIMSGPDALSPEPASGEWRDISTAPDDGTEILGYWRGSETYAIVSWSIDGWWKDGADDSEVSPPTHWMYLPEPPATKDGERT